MTGAAVAMTVMAATMLPSTLPLLRLDWATARSRLHTGAVGLGYAAVWAALGAATMPLAMLSPSRVAGGVALAVAGVYELSPLKLRCLARCRAPLARVVLGWRDSAGGALRIGVENGAWCAGCCAGLLAALLVLGAVSTAGMVAFGALVLVQKVAPFGVASRRLTAAALAAGSVAWLA